MLEMPVTTYMHLLLTLEVLVRQQLVSVLVRRGLLSTATAILRAESFLVKFLPFAMTEARERSEFFLSGGLVLETGDMGFYERSDGV